MIKSACATHLIVLMALSGAPPRLIESVRPVQGNTPAVALDANECLICASDEALKVATMFCRSAPKQGPPKFSSRH
jgi:hypothetical protein